jgi:hypothetical protein
VLQLLQLGTGLIDPDADVGEPEVGVLLAGAPGAGPATQPATIPVTCRGVMPRALNTPRSFTCSRVPSSTVFSNLGLSDAFQDRDRG